MIVGFCGAAGSGKDTAAEVLREQKSFVPMSFAATIKGVLCMIFNWTGDEWQDLKWKETPNDHCFGKTPREIAQSFGTDWGRNMVHPDIWVQLTMRMIKEAPAMSWVFTDVRFPNEAQAIRDAGGILIFVKCTDRETGTEFSEHESEAWLPWLELFADTTIEAPLGEIDFLQEAALNVVENYAYGHVPRHAEISPGTQDVLDTLAEDIRRNT